MVDFVKLKKMMSCQVCGEGHVNIIIIIIILFMSRFFYLIFYGLLMLFLLPNGHVIEFVCFLVEVGLTDKKKKKVFLWNSKYIACVYYNAWFAVLCIMWLSLFLLQSVSHAMSNTMKFAF